MATTTPSWNEGNTLRSAATIAAGGTATHDLDIAGQTTPPDLVLLQVDITDSGSATATVNLYASHDSGATIDTVALPGSFETDQSGSQIIRTVAVLGIPYVQVEIVNNDGSNATGNVAIHYAMRTWSTA
jgi:hypothetical protein